MTTLNDLFAEYLSRIEPSCLAVKRAKNAHEPLRNDLEKDEVYGKYIYKTLLSGSYGRDTAIFGIKDVDVIIETSFTKQDLRDFAKDEETEQECLLRLTQEAIRRTGRSARTRKNRRSVQVTLPEEVNDIGETLSELTMDVVPVLAEYGKDIEPMTIADKDLSEWFTTFPISQLQDSESRNQRSAWLIDRHLYKPLVKMFKAWKKVHYDGKKTPKGFVLECLTASYHNSYSTSWVNAVRDLFASIVSSLDPDNITEIPNVSDVSNSSHAMIPVAKTLDEARDVLLTIQEHLEIIEQAIEETETDLDKAARTLRLVFGSTKDEITFPLPSDLDDKGNGGKRDKGPNPLIPNNSKSNVREAPAFG